MVPTIQRLPARCATALRDNCAKLRNARATPCALAEGAVQNAVLPGSHGRRASLALADAARDGDGKLTRFSADRHPPRNSNRLRCLRGQMPKIAPDLRLAQAS